MASDLILRAWSLPWPDGLPILTSFKGALLPLSLICELSNICDMLTRAISSARNRSDVLLLFFPPPITPDSESGGVGSGGIWDLGFGLPNFHVHTLKIRWLKACQLSVLLIIEIHLMKR